MVKPCFANQFNYFAVVMIFWRIIYNNKMLVCFMGMKSIEWQLDKPQKQRKYESNIFSKQIQDGKDKA